MIVNCWVTIPGIKNKQFSQVMTQSCGFGHVISFYLATGDAVFFWATRGHNQPRFIESKILYFSIITVIIQRDSFKFGSVCFDAGTI